MIDVISDMLARIRNAQLARKEDVILPYSKIRLNICQLLVREGWLGKVEIVETNNKESHVYNLKEKFKNIRISLKYNQNGQPFITALKRISRPGQRIYVKKDCLPEVLNGLGMAVISTPQGLMTNKEARQKKVGGELFFEIW